MIIFHLSCFPAPFTPPQQKWYSSVLLNQVPQTWLSLCVSLFVFFLSPSQVLSSACHVLLLPGTHPHLQSSSKKPPLVWLLIVSYIPPIHSDPNPQHTTLKLSFYFLYFTRLWAPWSQDHTLSLCPQNNARYNILMRNFPCGPVAKAPRSQCRGPGFNPWSGNWIPHATTKDSVCLNKDQRSCLLQVRSRQLNK